MIFYESRSLCRTAASVAERSDATYRGVWPHVVKTQPRNFAVVAVMTIVASLFSGSSLEAESSTEAKKTCFKALVEAQKTDSSSKDPWDRKAQSENDPFHDQSIRVPIDDTGIADWSFLNQRSPFPLVRLRVQRGAVLRDDPQRTAAKKFDDIERICTQAGLPGTKIVFTNETASRTIAVKLTARFKVSVQDLLEFEKQADAMRTKRKAERSAAAAMEGRKSTPGNNAGTSDELSTSPAYDKVISKLEKQDRSQGIDLDDLKAAMPQMREDLRHLKTLTGRAWSLAALAVEEPDKDKKCKKTESDTFECDIVRTITQGLDEGLPAALLELLILKQRISFTVQFLDGTDKPSRDTGFLFSGIQRLRLDPLEGRGRLNLFPNPPDSKMSGSLKATVGWSEDADTTPPETETDPGEMMSAGPDEMSDMGNGNAMEEQEAKFSVAEPYRGARRNRLFGSAQVDMGQTLGDRARGSVSFSFKDGDLGGEDGDGEVSVSQYTVDVFAFNGLSLRFGKYSFAAPSSALAARERGEGVEAGWRWFSLGHIVKRESLTNVADDGDHDSKVFLLQAHNVPLPQFPLFRRASFLILRGEEDDPENPYTYWTAGGEVSFERAKSRKATEGGADDSPPGASNDKSSFSGSLAFYHSERDAEPAMSGSGGADDGRGTTGLLTLNYSRLSERNIAGELLPQQIAPWSVRLLAGWGTGDDPTTDRDEGYVGETAAFAPDRLFLSGFAGEIDTGDMGTIGPSLSNKIYGGLELSFNRFSPLVALSDFVLRSREAATSQKTVFKIHHYRFREPILGEKSAGTELNVDFEVERPKSVTWTLNLAYLMVGSALDDIIQDDPWSVSMRTTVKLGG